MRKKGFTLIELLAVIVILAIIALIATPIVLNIISETKESATLRSAEFYLKAVENSIAQEMLDGIAVEDGIYNIMEDGNLCLTLEGKTCKNGFVKVEVSGDKPSSGTVKIETGKRKDIKLKIQDKTIIEKDNELVFEDDNDSSNQEDLGEVIFEGTLNFENDDEFNIASVEISNEILSKITIPSHYNFIIDDTTNIKLTPAASYDDDFIYLTTKEGKYFVRIEGNTLAFGAWVDSDDPADFQILLGEHKVKLVKSNDEFIRYGFINNRSYSWLYSYDFIEGPAKIVVTAENESTPIYSNDNATFEDYGGGLVGVDTVDNSGLNLGFNEELYDAFTNNKIITITVTQIIDGKEVTTDIGGTVPECYDSPYVTNRKEYSFGNNETRFGT